MNRPLPQCLSEAAATATSGLLGLVAAALAAGCGPERSAFNGALEAADYWSDTPSILSAGLGFDGILGVPELTEDAVRAAGGSWYGGLTCASGDDPPDSARTSAATASGLKRTFRGTAELGDGLPVVFSWPVATDTVHPEDFLVTLNSGETVVPTAAGMFPNWELNERNTIVLIGDFGNRGLPGEAGMRFSVRVEVKDDGTPLTLVGPGGEEVSAVGLSWETDSTPYVSGPALVGAKLTRIDGEPQGEGMPGDGWASFMLPNDERALYDEGDFRLRMLTTGGFSPDGVTGVKPDQFQDFFRIHATGTDGGTVLIEEVGVDYAVSGGTLRVVGLSDLGLKADPERGVNYDDCYVEDRDNYIDVILVGDEAAARSITFLEIPAVEEGYRPFYNPGGPGPEPFEGVRYTAPGPRDLEPVILALDDAMRVDRD